jgi:thiamine-phosphate pyrophosphorylase
MHVPVVHLVTDRRLVPRLPDHVARALRGLPPGRVAVHLREKDLGGAALLELARELVAACHSERQLLLVNDRVDVALLSGADGVHLPSRGVPPTDARRLLGPDRLVGVSCHGASDVIAARDGGASFATFGPVYDTPSKRAFGPPVGLEALRDAATRHLPLVALGGVEPARVAEVVAAGAAAVGAIRAWLAEDVDASAAVRALLAPFP